jgi:voltage-gated potassium channel
MDAVAAATGAKQQRYITEGALQFKDQVRSPADLQRLSDFERFIYLPLVLSAILPIVVAVSNAAEDSGVSIAVNVVAWLVFVLDLVDHARLIRSFLKSGTGIFDLVVVVITAPWFLLPGFGASQILMLARLARLARLVFVSKSAQRVVTRLGKVGLFALGMLLFCSWMAYIAEHGVNHEFATFGDALWWGIVTLTTVGYGDIVPETEKGRVAGTFLMFTGLATLGLISGTLASAFRLTPSGATESDVPAPADDQGDAPVSAALPPDLVAELDALREQVAAVEERLTTILRGTEPI